jgi:transitional endoplasmic reticulum ATPase
VVRLIREDLAEGEPSEVVEQLINHTLEAQHHRPLHAQDANRLPEVYEPAFISSDTDLAAVAEGLKRTRSARLCLYGPPGTGKTAYGRWLAEQLGMPLLVRRASDFLSKYLGEAEQNMARAFAQAKSEGAVLLIDEVDSFLRDRRGAQHSWEVTHVNEMLTQVEAFQGVLIASTNLMDNLDPASLRRFDLKVKFDYLRPEQALRLFLLYCPLFGIEADEAGAGPRLARLTQLTPGDFAAVYRRHRFHPVSSAVQFVAALAGECEVKEAPVRRIGFVP